MLEQLLPRALQIAGLAAFAAAVLYWVSSGHESLLFVVASVALIALGAIDGLRAGIRKEGDRE